MSISLLMYNSNMFLLLLIVSCYKGSSSVGTSLNPDFLADFSTAAGKRSYNYSDSQESDPEWGCWRVEHELKNPSINFLFTTIDRVRSGVCGVHLSRYLLCLSEKTWQRLRPAGIFHDAIPYPSDRIGYPMHVKALPVQRRWKLIWMDILWVPQFQSSCLGLNSPSLFIAIRSEIAYLQL
ncbi:uncharacterized protein LOC144567865 [Carex rostrata]